MAYDATPVTVSVTLNTAVGDRATFGTPLFVYDAGDSTSPTPDFGGTRTRVYTSIEGMTDDGFLTTSDPYKAALAFFSQNPNVQQLVIGQQYTAGTADATAVAAVTAISEENDSWYVLTHYDHTEATVVALAAYIEARTRMFFTSDDTTASATTTYNPGSSASGDIAGKLADGNYTRSTCLWSQTESDFPECAFAGHNLPYEAGRATWSYLRLNGVPNGVIAGNPLTATHQTNLAARNANFIPIIRGLSVTREGKVASGEWIDNIRGRDALMEDMEGTLFDLLVNQLGGKIPYTNQGLNLIRNAMENSLNRFVVRNFILDDYRINIPDAAEIAIADKNNRVLQGVRFTANLVGAIHTITIAGNLEFSGT